MKGAVFIALNDFIESQFGIAHWEAILAAADTDSGGIYTSVANYDDAEMFKLVGALCEQLNVSREQALKLFGIYLFGVLNKKHPIFTTLQPDFFKFLASVDDIVHVEVRKLFEGVYLPVISAVEQSDNKILLRYESKRQMCELAEGLIQGAAEFYHLVIKITQHKCYHKGHDHCLIEVEKIGEC
ncbi:heme NO-binding domain-containing protein [Marinagarivorans algicola]|uniref:heme NO-binding domain-containing protein n=1 Tax=Marinagarivorans algicola TaxID=1513270 RepID=UPI0006B5B8D0|nr:heme NO-binding domain-containing protein [Marinagarivorans algicola]